MLNELNAIEKNQNPSSSASESDEDDDENQRSLWIERYRIHKQKTNIDCGQK